MKIEDIVKEIGGCCISDESAKVAAERILRLFRVNGMLPDCKHEHIESSDGCDECLDCGARNF